MSRSKQSRKVWAGAMVTAVGLAGSAHAAVLYSSEDFEAGTPNYIIEGTGPYTLIQLQDGTATNITSQVAVAGTDYITGSPSRSGIFANNGLPDVITNEPTGLHAFVSNSANRNLTLTDPMTLIADGTQTVNINFATMVYAFEDGTRPTEFQHVAEVTYSALGDFSDSVQIATYSTAAIGNPGTALNHYTVVEDNWSTLDVSISSTDVTFTDTAKIRFNKMAPTNTNHMVFYDNITVSGVVPEPGTAALLGLAGFALVRRRRP